MKQLFLYLFLIVYGSSMSQYLDKSNMPKDVILCLKESGVDNFSLLSECESYYLNFRFQSMRDTFDFSNKRVDFFRIKK